MQVYSDLRTLTARPAIEVEARAPHRLYGSVDGAQAYSVGLWLGDAASVLREAERMERLPVIVGGTGLYFKALTQGLSDIPTVPDAVRERVRGEAEERETPALHAELGLRDPAMAARLRPSDRQRVLRALEVLEATGRSLAHWQGRAGAPLLAPESVMRLFLAPDREVLRARIDQRFDAMMQEGALDEARALGRRGLDPALPVMRAHGVPGLLAHLRGALSLDEAVARGKADTRAYAKRQLTWFRHGMPGWTWVGPDEAFDVAWRMLAGGMRAVPVP